MTDDGGTAAGGFQVVGEDVVWKGARFASLGNVQVSTPEGEVVERVVFHHPGAVAVVPLHDDGTVTLVRQYRVALDREIWEIPAGLRDVDGEELVRTAERELAEEAGLAAGKIRELVTFNNSPGISDEAVVIFLGTDLSPVDHDRQSEEERHMVVDRFALSEALAMVNDGRITDAKTMIGLLLAAHHG